MSLNRLSILACLFVLSTLQGTAQELSPVSTPGGCGVRGHSAWLDWFRQHRDDWYHDIERGADTSWLYVPLTVHIVGRDNGSGYFRATDAIRAVCEMNDQFAPAFIRFYLDENEPFNYLNSDLWYEHDLDGGADLITVNNLPGRMNAYVVEDPAGNCGYSWYDAIVLRKGCSASGNTTWAHEAGHHLSLPHPFLGWEGTTWQPGAPAPTTIDWNEVENLDSSNCRVAGDYFCDTRADYLSYRWGCNDDRESTVILTDPNGLDFRADATIIMGYASDACAGRFSAEQREAMRANLLTEHVDYLQTFELGPMIDDNARVQLSHPVDTQTAQYNNVNFSWQPVENAKFYVLEVALAPNFSFTLINRTISNGETTAHVNKNIPNNRLLYWRVKTFGNWDLCQQNTNMQTGVFKTINISATNDLERVATIELTPNPVFGGGTAMLAVETSESVNAQIQLMDAAGRLVQSQNVRLGFGANQLEIKTNELAPGIYSVALQTQKGTVVKRLSVME